MSKFALIFALAISLLGCQTISTKDPNHHRPLCAECREGIFIQSIGRCFVCDAATDSGSFELCEDHAWKMNKCQACMKNPPVLRCPERHSSRGAHWECLKQPFVRMFGNCERCGFLMNSATWRLCGKCSTDTNQCGVCRKSLTLCIDCRSKAIMHGLVKNDCERCHEKTKSDAYKLCEGCAKETHQCEMCEIDMKRP